MGKQTLTNKDTDELDGGKIQSNGQARDDLANTSDLIVPHHLLDRFSPLRFLIVLIIGIFLAEVVAMVIVFALEPMPYHLLTLLDATIMVVLIFPVVYFLSMRPLIRQIEWRRQAEEALFRSMELQERFFDSIDTLIAYMDRDFNFIRVNEAYAKADEQDPEYFIGKNHFELFPHAENQALFQQVVDSGESLSIKEKAFEYPEHPERGISYWNWSLLPVKGADGRVEGVVLSLVDVTERKLAEQALQEMNETLEHRVAERTLELQESEERFRSALDNMLEGCQIVGFDWRYIYVNDVAVEHVHQTKEHLLGSNLKDVYPDIEKTSVFGLMRRCMDERIPAHTIDEFTYPDGLRSWLELSIQPVPEGIFILSMDITERKKAEEALLSANDELEKRVRERTKELAVANQELLHEIYERKDAERQLRIQTTAMEAAANGILITDPHGEILWINSAVSKMSGYSPDEIIGENTRIFKSGQHDLAFYQQMWDTILAGEVWRGEIKNRLKNGSVYIEEQTITPVRDENNQVAYFIAIKHDITQQKQVQAELEHERARLKSILDTMPDGVYIIDQNYDIEYINPVIEREFGTVNGRKCYEYFHNLDDPCLWCKNERVFAGTSFVGEQDYSKNNKVYEVFDAPLVNADRTVSKLKLLHDITRRKKMELDLEQRNLELQVASRAERNQRQFAEALVAAAFNLNKSQNLDEVLKIILEQIKDVIPYQFASIGLLDGDLLYEAGHFGDDDFVEKQINNMPTNFLDSIPLLDKMRKSNQPILIPDTQQESDCMDIENFKWCRSFLSAPLMVDEKMIGSINLFDGRVGFFTREMCDRLVAFAAHAAAAIQNAWLFNQVQVSSERLQSLSRRLVEVQEAERLFIARELHDEAGQMLTSLLLDLQLLEKKSSNPEAILEKVSEMEDSLNEISKSLHNVAMTIRPASLDHLGLVPALRQHVELVGEKYGLKAQFRTKGILKRLPSNIETILYRIVQESMTNVVRHARATQVDVVLTVREGNLIVLIEDDGIGFNPEEVPVENHLGLLGIRERVEMIGGRLMIESVPGEGTTVMVEVSYADSLVDRG